METASTAFREAYWLAWSIFVLVTLLLIWAKLPDQPDDPADAWKNA